MPQQELIPLINKELSLRLPENLTEENLHQQLADHINEMILHRFEQLISLLYRIDVSEAKIKSLLQQQPGTDAGKLIAALIIERQQQKVAARKQFRNQPPVDEDEKW